MFLQVSVLVLDLSGMQYVDPSGAGTIQTLGKELGESISIYLANPSSELFGRSLELSQPVKSLNILSFY